MLVCLTSCGLLRRNGARTPARASASRTPPFGRRGIPREMADSRVLATARPRFRFGLTRAPHESPTSGGYRRMHIRLRVAVLRDSPHFRGFRPAGGGEASRAWHPREFGAVLGVSASLPLHAPPLPSSSRRYAPQCFVAGIPAPCLATCLTAHPTNRGVACRSVRHSPPRPLPHLPIGAFFFAASALADVSSASLIHDKCAATPSDAI